MRAGAGGRSGRLVCVLRSLSERLGVSEERRCLMFVEDGSRWFAAQAELCCCWEAALTCAAGMSVWLGGMCQGYALAGGRLVGLLST